MGGLAAGRHFPPHGPFNLLLLSIPAKQHSTARSVSQTDGRTDSQTTPHWSWSNDLEARADGRKRPSLSGPTDRPMDLPILQTTNGTIMIRTIALQLQCTTTTSTAAHSQTQAGRQAGRESDATGVQFGRSPTRRGQVFSAAMGLGRRGPYYYYHPHLRLSSTRPPPLYLAATGLRFPLQRCPLALLQC